MSSAVPTYLFQPRNTVWRTALHVIGVMALLATLLYLPYVLQSRSLFGVRLSNMQLLNIGLSQVNLTLISIIGAVSLNYLTGCAGLVSVGHAAFFALGSMAAAVTGMHVKLPFLATLVAAMLAGALAGVVAGLPSLRVRGLYFVLSTLAIHFIVVFIFAEYQYAFHDVTGVALGDAKIGSFEIDTGIKWYFFLLPIAALSCWLMRNTLFHREGRAVLAMRDNELAAAAAGIDVRILKLKVFAFSSAFASLAGALQAYYLTNVAAEMYSLNFAIQFIAMIIVGGMGTIGGGVIGAIVWLLLPSILMGAATELKSGPGGFAQFLLANRPQVVNLIFGSIVALILIFAPHGFAGFLRSLWQRMMRLLPSRGRA